MLMGGDITPHRDLRGRFTERNSLRPDDFEAMFVRVGRVACEEQYGVGRLTITRWLDECGKDRLLRARAEHVTKQGEESMGAVARYGRETVDQWRAESPRSLSRGDVAKLLSQAYPIDDPRIVSPELASAAAHHLRLPRNGWFFISPTGAGDWWVGLKRKSSGELLEMAQGRGFDPATLTGDDR